MESVKKNTAQMNGAEEECQVEEDVTPFVFDGEDSEGHDAARKLNTVEDQETRSYDYIIYGVPETNKKVKPEAYRVYTIRIGPVGGEISSMIQHKWRYTRYLFQRTNDPLISRKLFNDCTNLIHDLAPTIVARYNGISPGKITEVKKRVLADACFILELFLRYDQYLDMKLQHESDSIFTNVWMIPAIRRDMVIINNQIPFFVLQKLYELIKPHIIIINSKPPNSLVPLALQFFHPTLRDEIKKEPPHFEYRDMLDLLHKFYLPSSDLVVKPDATSASSISIAINLTSHGQHLPTGPQHWGYHFGATELAQAGIEFSRQSSDRLVNITFTKGVLKLPPLFIDDSRDSLFRNLIVYEQSGLKYNYHITSYVVLLKTLIRSSRDVNLLRKKGIITQNWIEDDEFSAHFNSLLDGVVQKDFYFADFCDEVDAYARKYRFRRKMSALYRTYFSTAWSMTAFIAAACLFILTCVQTYFAIYPR